MPQLARLRLVSIGHPSARFGDLVLDLRDPTGHATDATLWLRNGGGKSSLLNLFFALVRPDRREFLGNRAEAKQRRLEDYVLPRDRGVVAAEWTLDSGGNGGPGPSYVTGVLYEWGGSAGADAGQLRRLFFAGHARAPRFSIDELPLIAVGDDGKLVRRSMSAFRQELATLRDAEPDLQLFWATTNREWTDHLISVGIDPELFTYQIRMNQREGGADEVFRFADHDQFVDFLLGLALDPALGDGVTANIGTFRQELRDRKDQWLPEIELVGGILERLSPLTEVHQQRTRWVEDVATRGHEFAALMQFFAVRSAQLAKAIAELEGRRDERAGALEAAREATHRELLEAATLRAHAAELRHRAATAQTRHARADLDAALHRVRLWEAAVPLWAALRAAASAAGYLAELERKRAQFAPELGELKRAATRYAGALRESAHAQREAAAAELAAAAAERKRASALRATAAEHGALGSQARERVRNLDERLDELRRERATLERDAVLAPGETATAARARHAADGERAAAAIAALHDRERELARDLAIQRGERTAALSDVVRAEERANRLADELAAATAVRRELEASDELRRQLESETIDALRLSPAIVHQIHDASRHARDQAIGDRVAQTLDERAVMALEADGLLPPSRDVEQVLAVVRSRLQAAWSGWAYLEAHVPREQRARFIHAIPMIVDGVVIADAELPHALEQLATADLALEGPVVVAPQSAFTLPADAAALAVLAPTGDGRFDRAAADHELRMRRARLARYAEAVSGAETHAAALQRIAIQLEQFFERTPSGWFAEREQRIAAERATHAVQRDRAADLERAIGVAGRERDELTARLADLERQRADVELRIARADGFATRALHDEAWQRDRATAADAIDGCERAAADARADAERADEQADAADRRAAAAREQAAGIEAELRSIDYPTDEPLPDGDLAAPAAAPVDDLRQDYRRRKDVYEERVGEDTLDRLAAADQAQSALHRARFERLARQYDLGEGAVGAALEALGEADSPDDRLRDANEARADASGALGHATTSEQRAKEKLDDASRHRHQLDPAAPPPRAELPENPELADAGAHDTEQRAHALARDADAIEEDLDATSAQLAAATRSLELVQQAHKRAGSLGSAYGDLLTASPGDLTLDVRDEDIGTEIDDIEAVLKQGRAQLVRLDAARAAAVRAVRSFAGESRFDVLDSLLARKLIDAEPEDLERLAWSHISDLGARRQQLEAQVTSIDRHRETLVTEALNAAEEGLALLRSAANQSRLPEHVPGLGGAQFLRITTHTIDDLAERRARIATLIDEVCDAGQLPSGLPLVQRAVRRLARPIKVYVLHPDPALGRESVEIPEIARCSGGEQLTSAILLYCTLAQVRARARGATRKGTGVLILDNPIGRASRARFLELQREVARTMGIQLVYTTGVNDYDALRALPKIVRLRNQRVDRGSGHQVVELEDGTIEAIQLGRVEG
ncbi:MAG TPA: hypothetical protein VLM79_28505 [Kofleriaceae bacterium]|nr:hypothetical protein [Kofleriaceae bacterium]